MNGENTEISDDEEVREPKITALDPNERKLARRLRIQRRLQKTKQQARVAAAEEVEKDDNRTLLEKQLENSENQMEVLLVEGKELVTNVRIGNDAREVKRREDEVVAREKRLQRLEDEANESVEKFNEVNSKWQVILQLNDPLDLHHSIEEQKVKCAELIAQKDVLIKELRRELKLADERFDKDQLRQKQDLWLLGERIDNQVKVMRKAYKEELKLIEEVIDVEHRQLMEVNNKKWESLYKERERLEVDQMEEKFEAVERHEDEIYRVAVEHQEKFREVKIKLETDIQVLQQELEQVKAQCLMNNEKLVYNYQVLKKREEENLIVRSQQKRRINRLQDVVSTLRKKIAETEKSLQSESARLTDEVLRLHQNIRDIEIKANHFAVVNDRKYHQVWKLNREMAEEKLQKILDIDQILYEQQLGLDWNPPDLTLLRQQDLASYRSAMEVVSDLFQEKGAGDMDTELEAWKSPSTREELEERCMSERLLQHILKLVADSSGFLAEQRLKELLKHHSDEEKTLVKLDSVFTALGVKTEADMLMLKDHFLLYATCSMCSAQEESTEMVIAAPDSHEYLSDSTSTGEDTETACMGSAEEDASSASFSAERAEIFNKDKLIRHICSDKSHTLVIDPVFVLKALRDFVAKLAPVQQGINGGTLASKRSTVSRLLSAQDVTAFWTRYREIFSPEREKLWDGLLHGLQKYHQILEERHILNEETERLRCQNAEFRKLLHFYIQGSENESMFLSSREHLPPITKLRNGSILKNRKKFPKYRHSSGYIRTLPMEEPTIP